MYPRRPHAGMTLLEILVVIAIIAIAAGGMLALLDGDERSQVDREARRFAGALEYATQRAQVRHETLGVSANGAELRFWRRGEDGRWQGIPDDGVLAVRSLPAPLHATLLTYGGRPVGADAIVPLRPSGRNEPYSMALAGTTVVVTLSADPLNRVLIGEPVPIAR